MFYESNFLNFTAMKIFYLVLTNLQKKLDIMLEFSSMFFVYRYIHTISLSLLHKPTALWGESRNVYCTIFQFLHSCFNTSVDFLCLFGGQVALQFDP